MNDEQLLRYSRHILLDEWGIEGQQNILNSHILVIGAGGLGCAAALYLASSGVGRITLMDADRVDLTNLQRQVAHTTERVGQLKVDSLREALLQVNPSIEVVAIPQKAEGTLLIDQVGQAQVVLDCTDNFASRQAINHACTHGGKPLVSGSAIRWDGQVSVFDPRSSTSPCYACIFPADSQVQEAQCSSMGVFAPLVGMIGSSQAAEALHLASGRASALTGRLLMLNASGMNTTSIQLQRNPNCKVCGHLHATAPTPRGSTH